MKKNKMTPIRLVAAALAVVCVCAGVALAAGEGGQGDPLVTLSYLTKTVIPSILSQVEEKTQPHRDKLADELTQVVQDYSAKMETALEGVDAKNTASYHVVTLKKGQKLNMEVGCEVMLRVGTAQCVAPSSPGLIDTTTGQGLNNGGALTVNHLYMATISERAVTATANTVKVLVRGGYSVA